MKTLHLNRKKKWFDLILSGEKKEEYRDVTEYWAKRFYKKECFYTDTLEPLNNNCNMFKKFDSITFSNGYSKNRPQFVIELKGITVKYGLEKWGARKNTLYFVLHLGKIISSN